MVEACSCSDKFLQWSYGWRTYKKFVPQYYGVFYYVGWSLVRVGMASGHACSLVDFKPALSAWRAPGEGTLSSRYFAARFPYRGFFPGYFACRSHAPDTCRYNRAHTTVLGTYGSDCSLNDALYPVAALWLPGGLVASADP